MNPVIELNSVRRWFGTRMVLDGLSFRVNPGESFALLGRNGAGKTTAIRVLLGFLAPHSGTARILGDDGRSLAPSTRERIGYVAEGHKLFLMMTVPQLLDYEQATRARFDRAFAEKALARLELSTDVSISNLSKGQQAMLALTVASAGRPEVLVFDDPAMGLDVVHRRELMATLAELIADQGVTLFFSSHLMADVERMADRVGILAGGKLVVDARIDDLRRRIQRRFARPKAGTTWNGGLEREVPGLLRAREVPNGFELTLLDLDDVQERALRERTEILSEPQALNLEDLFIEFAGSDEP